MKAAQKRRLLTKDKEGKFINNDNFQVLRNRSIISEDSILESEKTYEETGILWVVDKKLTKEWEDSKKPVQEEKPKKEPKKQPVELKTEE